MSADLNTVKIAIRAVLQSSKYGMNIRELIGDYKELNGTLIPFKVFGFQNIEDFLRSIPDTVSMQNRGGETIVNYTQCEDTAHIEKLVKDQKESKKKPKKSHAPKPLGHSLQSKQGPFRRSPIDLQYAAETRQNSAKLQCYSNNIRNDWNEWPTVGTWESTQLNSEAFNNPQIDEWSTGTTSEIVSPLRAKSVNSPGPSTSYSNQNALYDDNMFCRLSAIERENVARFQSLMSLYSFELYAVFEGILWFKRRL